MSEPLSLLLTRFRRDQTWAFEGPVLVWQTPAPAGGEHWERTQGHTTAVPLNGDPRIFKVEKGMKVHNAFQFGITVGRIDTNDLVIENDSVSRFHAFLRHEERTHTWFVTDAESKNGTWVGGQRLEPNNAVALKDEVEVKFGDATLQFLLGATFRRLLEGALKRPL